jgi:hypothetical protein
MDKPVPFVSKVKVIKPDEFEAFGISEASIATSAKTLLPADFDFSANPDILPIVFNLAVVNEFNENGDGMDSEVAIACVKKFKNKPINIEHIKPEIVGHIVNASLSDGEFDFSDNDLESFRGRTDTFYITAAAVIYRSVFPNLAAQIIECSDENSENYQEISASWEVAYKKFKIAVGSRKLEECRVADREEAMQLKKFVKGFGGKGVNKDGEYVGRLISGDDVLGLGAAMTLNPAAKVKGVYAMENLSEEIYAEKNSPNTKKDVRDREFKKFLDMDAEQFKQLMEGLTESIASVLKKDSDAKSVGEIVAQTLTEHNSSWTSKIEAERKAKQDLEAKVEELTNSFASAQGELNTMKQQVAAQAAAQVFNDRMNFLDSEYEFSEKESELIANEVKQLSTEEASFESYKEKVSILFSHKSKASIAKAEEEIKAKVEEEVAKRLTSNASVAVETTETVEEEVELETTEEASASVSNNNADAAHNESLVEKLKKNFKVEVEN